MERATAGEGRREARARLSRWLLAAGLVAGAVLLVLDREEPSVDSAASSLRSAEHTAPPESLESENESASGAEGSARATSEPTNRVVEPFTVRARDVDGVPVEGAEVHCGVEANAFGVSLGRTPTGITDARGELVMPSSAAHVLGCVRKSGYLTTTFLARSSGMHEVVLPRSRRIAISANGPLGRVADCLVLATLREAVPLAEQHLAASDTQGVLGVARPTWRGRTGPDGTCVLEVPIDEELRLSAYHAFYYPVEAWALASEPLPAGEEDVQRAITLRDMMGCAVAVPGDIEWAAEAWHVDDRARSQEQGAVTRNHYCVSRLRERMPRASVRTFVPKVAEEGLEFEFSGLDVLGREWALRDRFVPLRTLLESRSPELVAAPAPAVVDAVLLVGGRRVDGAAMRLARVGDSGRSLSVPVLSGQCRTVPAGDYTLEIDGPIVCGPDLVASAPTTVVQGSRTALTYVVTLELARVEIEPRVENDALHRIVWVSVSGPDVAMSNMWKQASGPLVSWVAPGEYQVEARAHGCAVAKRTLVVRAGENRIVVDDLVLRP